MFCTRALDLKELSLCDNIITIIESCRGDCLAIARRRRAPQFFSVHTSDGATNQRPRIHWTARRVCLSTQSTSRIGSSKRAIGYQVVYLGSIALGCRSDSGHSYMLPGAWYRLGGEWTSVIHNADSRPALPQSSDAHGDIRRDLTVGRECR